MGLVLSISDFIVQHLNLIMIICGFIAIGAMFLILCLNRKRSHKIELDRVIKLQEDKKLDAEMEKQFAHAINLSLKDLQEDDKISLKNLEDYSDKKEEVVDEELVQKDLEQPKVDESEVQIQKDIEEQKQEEKENVLDDYENVIKESDAMLEAMQNIIDDNLEEMQKIESEPLKADSNSKDANLGVSIVSKYKVLFDKVKKEWVVKKEGATRATKRCKTKEEAIEFAKKCTIDAEIGSTFHQKDGKFQKRAKK